MATAKTPRTTLDRHIAIPIRIGEDLEGRLDRLAKYLAETHPGILAQRSMAGRAALFRGLELWETEMEAARPNVAPTTEGPQHCYQLPACSISEANEPAPRGIDPKAWREIGTVEVCMCSCSGCRPSKPKPKRRPKGRRSR